MVSETDLSYMAGFFDGEGCIGIYMRKAWTAQVTVSQIDTDVLDDFMVLSGNVFMTKVNGGHVSNYTWYGRAAIQVVRSLHPYLRVKKDQAELFLEYAKYTEQIIPGQHFTPEIRSRIGEIAQELRDLKRKRGI